MHSTSPVLIVEDNEFYVARGQVPEGPSDHLIQPGRAKVLRLGGDLTVVTYAGMVPRVLAAAGELAGEGVEIEVIDLRTLDRASTDFETIGKSLKKTGGLLTVEQAPRSNSIGAHIITECLQRFPDHLRRPPRSVAAPSVPVPVSRKLEQLCLPDSSWILEAVRSYKLSQASLSD
jgi:2-oxoisovalerate dehydrogenase E1 component